MYEANESSPLSGGSHYDLSNQQIRWKSCCFDVDSRFCRFSVCMLVSLFTLVAALFRLVTAPSCDTYGFWGPILSLIIGIWTPTPKSYNRTKI